MKEDEDFRVSWTEGGQRVKYSWARLSADSRRRVWGLLDAGGREAAREKLGGTWTGRRWLRANDIPELVARDKSIIAAADKRAQEERLRAEKARQEEQLRDELKPRLLEEIRTEWAAEREALVGTADQLKEELRESQERLKQEGAESTRLRTELDRVHAHVAKLEADRTELNTELGRLREKVGTGHELDVQISAKRDELTRLSDHAKKVAAEDEALSIEFDAFRRQVALRRTDRFLWDAAPVEIVEHLSFLIPAARTDGAIAVLIHRGMAPSDIAKSLRVSKERVATVLEGDGNRESVLNETREWMGPAPDGYYSDGKLAGAELVAKVQELRGSGASEREIARVTGAPLSRVRRILRQEPPAETEKAQPTAAPPAAGSD